MGVFVLCPKPQNKVPESRSTSQWGGFLRIDAPTKSTPHKPKEHINPTPTMRHCAHHRQPFSSAIAHNFFCQLCDMRQNIMCNDSHRHL